MTAVKSQTSAATLLDAPHHDGSDACVVERPEELGGDAVLRLRVPRATILDSVVLRYIRDGEPKFIAATVDEETDTDTWWRVSFPLTNYVTRYRWMLSSNGRETSLNPLGMVPFDAPSADDYVLTVGPDGPAWHLGAVVYEIYPDRFASSGVDVDTPEWAIRRGWDELPNGRGPVSGQELFGGDLPGIEAHLDHIELLGTNALYLTPIFPAGSSHRYDATTFEHVDPLLGGDEAFASLVAAAHARGMRLIGDLTTNHVGVGHEWFGAAREGGIEREFFYFDESLPFGYASWFDVPTVPKLDWRSEELRRRMIDVVRRWLDNGLDGWRIDVAHMTGRFRDHDLNHEAARLVRDALEHDELLIAEHGHDFRPDLDGRGWQGVMNYAGFMRPVWSWLRAEELPKVLEEGFWGTPFGLRPHDGREAVAAMRSYRAGVPWGAVLHSWTLLDSHDTARFKTISGTRAMHVVGLGLQMTTPGVPLVYAGDELGLEGDWGEDARRPMPWERPETWDGDILEEYRRLIALRRSSEALARGGIRYVHVEDDVIAYLRESRQETLLCLAARADHHPIRVPFTSLETLYGADARDGVLPDGGPSFHVWRVHG